MTYKKFMSLFLLAGSIVSTLCSCAATDSSAVVGYVDEHPITMEEFNYFLSQQKSSVCQSYSQLYGITSFDSAFWNSEYGDSTPLDSARASAKEACLEAYATQMLAEKTTSAEFLSFSQLKENAENFNTARKESTSNGGIVYGPIEYSFDSYYHRYLSQLENDIKEYWISTNAVSDADIDAFYSENQNLFSLNGDADVSAIYLSYIPSDLSADNIFLGLEEGVSLEDIQTQYPYVTEDAASGGTTYYVDSTIGDDSNSGTSPETPWKSLDKVTATTFLPGDTILLKSGSVWNGEWLWPKGSGTADAPIKIDKYGGDALPVINGMGIDRGMNYSGAVHLRNQEYWEIRNLEVTNDDDFDVDIDLSRPQGDNSWSSQAETRNGILIIADGDLLNDDDDGIFDHIYIENCYVHDVDGPNDWNDTFTGGIIYNVVGTKIRPNTSFRDIRIAYNTIRKVDLLGITGFVQMAKSGYQDDVDTYNLWMEDIYIGHNYIEDVAQGGIDLCDARNAVVEYNVVDGFLKRYPNFRPTVALYPWKCENSVLQYNEVYNGPSTNADGSPYDMDSALKNVVYQFNYSHNNPCGWMLYMGRNTNDIIRYNISDDGGDFIIKYFLTANATPAYFVNNVIMYDGARTTFMHRDPFKSQTYFYNNVFYNKSTTTTTTWHDTKRYLGNLGSVTFSHNCFYEASGIHSQYEPADDYKVTENPDMVNPGQTPQQNSDGILSGATVWDGYKLNASSPLIDAGIYVPQMGTTDFYGTQLYWGNAPDIGVHEYQQGEYNNPSNFALGKTVTSNNSHESLTPDLMVDGIYSQNSRWAAANSDLPIWLDIDFGKDTTFNKVVLTENIVSGWASPRIASFNLQIPTADGYQTIYTYDGEIGEGKDFTFDTVTASHLRMEITSLRADTSTHGRGETDPSIVEFEVYKVPVIREPQNLLLNKSVSASSSHPSCPASKVNDGDASQGSRWAAANSDLPAWLEFNLGSEQTFNSVTITENIVPNWASERITGLEFQAWNGTEYTTISTYSGTIGTSKTISLPETTSSKFKVLITGLQEDTTKNSKGQTDPSIQEIELYYR